MMFKIGQKVVCVDDASRDAGKIICGRLIVPGLDGLTRGAIYTISGFGISWRGAPEVYVAEISRPPTKRGELVGYFPDRFRPVVEPKAELPAEITALLDVKNHTPLPEDVPGREAFV